MYRAPLRPHCRKKNGCGNAWEQIHKAREQIHSPGAQFCKSPIKDELFHPTSIIQNDSLYDLSDQRSEICAPHYTHKDTLY